MHIQVFNTRFVWNWSLMMLKVLDWLALSTVNALNSHQWQPGWHCHVAARALPTDRLLGSEFTSTF